MKIYKPDYVIGKDVNIEDIDKFEYLDNTNIKIILKDKTEVIWECNNNEDKCRVF